MVCGLEPIRGAAKWLGTVERILLKIALRLRCSVHRHDLKRGAAAIKHREARATPDLLNDLWQRGAEFFGVDGHIHIKFILS